MRQIKASDIPNLRPGRMLTWKKPSTQCFESNRSYPVEPNRGDERDMRGYASGKVFVRCECGFQEWFNIDGFHCDMLDAKLDLNRPITTRGGCRVGNVEFMDDPDRPIRARVYLPTGEVTLTYPVTGIFYKGVEQPIDLINVRG